MKNRKFKRPASQEGDTPAEKILQGDDRNLVLVDEDFEEADFEERVWLYWQRHRTWIVGTLVLCVAILGLSWGYRFYQEEKMATTQQAFLETRKNPDALASFAKAHEASPLAGLALLEKADRAYVGEQFAEAAKAYEDSARLLQDTLPADRARMGHALALARAGETEAARRALTALADNTKTFPAYRAEATYHLAMLLVETGDRPAALQRLETIRVIDTTQRWTEKAAEMMRLLPSVSAAASAPALGAPAAESAD